MKKEHNVDFYALCSNAAQNTLKQVEIAFKSFFALLKLKQKGQYTADVHLPKYLKKDGYYQVTLNCTNLNRQKRKEGILQIPNTNIEFGSFHATDAQQIRFIPKSNYISVEIIYNRQEHELKQDNHRYMSIDLGVNNLCTVTSNVCNAFIIDGKRVKSINHHYNKYKAKLQSKLSDNQYTSHKIQNITRKRNFRIDTIFHNISKYIVNQAVNNNINTIIIGLNKGWKQETNIGKKNNQNFTQIPHSKLIHQINYKAKLMGINVVTVDESYTSKASYLDNDFIPDYNPENENIYKFSGKRVYRGLYKSSTGQYINADINGSLNIMRKYLTKCNCDSCLSTVADIGLVVRPVRIKLV